MSGFQSNSFDASVRLDLTNSSTSGLSLGYTGSSQLDFNLPVSYGSSGQVLTTNGSGQLSWSNAGTGGGAGTNGTSGTSGQSGSSGTSGVNGTSGQSGSSGTAGVSGSSGTSGQSGSSGTAGVSGSSGTSGQSGTSGTSGQGGSSGQSGSSGTSGQSGSSGSSGTSGSSGISPTPINVNWSNSANSFSNLSISSVNTTGKMIGATGGFYFTPQSSGQVFVNYEVNLSVSADTIIELRWGTGAAPADGASATGSTAVDKMVTYSGNLSISHIISGLTPSVQYWFGLCLKSKSGTIPTIFYDYINGLAIELVSAANGTSGSAGTSGSSGFSAGTTFWYGTSTQSQTLATGSSLISLTVSAENNVSGATAAVFDQDGQYQITWTTTLGEKPSGGYLVNAPKYLWSTFLKYNGVTVGESTTAALPFVFDQDPTGTDALFTLSGQSSIYATAGSTLELWSQYQKETLYLRPINGFTGSTSAKMFVTKLL